MPKISMPASRLGRLVLGVGLILGGVVGFLPVVGFWMIPLGLVVLSQDFPGVRRFRRRWTVALMRFWHTHKPAWVDRTIRKYRSGKR